MSVRSSNGFASGVKTGHRWQTQAATSSCHSATRMESRATSIRPCCGMRLGGADVSRAAQTDGDGPVCDAPSSRPLFHRPGSLSPAGAPCRRITPDLRRARDAVKDERQLLVDERIRRPAASPGKLVANRGAIDAPSRTAGMSTRKAPAHCPASTTVAAVSCSGHAVRSGSEEKTSRTSTAAASGWARWKVRTSRHSPAAIVSSTEAVRAAWPSHAQTRMIPSLLQK